MTTGKPVEQGAATAVQKTGSSFVYLSVLCGSKVFVNHEGHKGARRKTKPRLSPARHVEIIELLWRELAQINSLPARRFIYSPGVSLCHNYHVLPIGHLTRLISEWNLIAIERKSELSLPRNQKNRDRKMMRIELCQLISDRTGRQRVVQRPRPKTQRDCKRYNRRNERGQP